MVGKVRLLPLRLLVFDRLLDALPLLLPLGWRVGLVTAIEDRKRRQHQQDTNRHAPSLTGREARNSLAHTKRPGPRRTPADILWERSSGNTAR
jgi:hypothetical protein